MSTKVLLICLARLLISQHPAEAASVTKYDQSQHGTYNVQIHLKNLEVIAVLDESMFSGGAENDIYDYDYTDVSGMTSQKPSSNTTTSTSVSLTTVSTTTESPTKPTTPAGSSGSKNTTNNRLTTIINTKVTARPNKNGTLALKPGTSGGNANKYNTTNVLNIVMPSSPSTKAPPHNKISETSALQTKGSTPAPSVATTAGTTLVTPPGDGTDYTLMDSLSIPVEIQQPPGTGSSDHGSTNHNSAGHMSVPVPVELQVPVAQSHPLGIRKCAPGYFRDSSGKCRRIRKPHLPFLQMVHTPGVIKSFQGAESSTKKMKVPESLAHPKTKEDKLVMDLATKMSKEEGTKVLNSH